MPQPPSDPVPPAVLDAARFTLARLLPQDAEEDGPHPLESPTEGLTRSSFLRDGVPVAEVRWEPEGTPFQALTDLGADGIGWRVEYVDGRPSFAAPHVGGQVHGHTVQWDSDGEVLSVSAFERGTGVDYWCDACTGELSEEHPSVEGLPHGLERWWDGAASTVFHERGWSRGTVHGIEREWTEDKLDEDSPRFWLHGEEVDRPTYDAACAKDPSPPPYRAQDDAPYRTLPVGFRRLVWRASEE